MLRYYDILRKNAFFRGFSDEEIGGILERFGAYKRSYGKNEIIREQESVIVEIGFVVQGVAYVTKTDYWGNRTILTEIGNGESFGESLGFFGGEKSPIAIVSARKGTEVIHIKMNKLMEGLGKAERIYQNLIKLMAEKAVTLQMKNDILSQKTTREKLMLYFEYESKTANSKTFRIRFTRGELAEFLCLNPSAMSRELGKMRDEGLLTFHKNKFKLIQ